MMSVSTGYHRSLFARVASRVSRLTGHPIVFAIACAIVVLWGLSGPLFGFSDTWQLVINTSTTIVTFLMVFLIQNTQTRDSMAVQVKLDELIRAVDGAHVALLDLEELTEEELTQVRAQYLNLARKARDELRRGIKDTGAPRLDGQGDSPAAGKKKKASQT